MVSFTHEQNISWTALRMSRTMFAGHMLRTHGGPSANEKGEKFACNYNDDDLLDYGNFPSGVRHEIRPIRMRHL